jgi:tetratricopeptide (TPR) repeat protein
MANLSLKEFISELNARLEKFSHNELKEIIRGQAMNLPPRERGEYLDRFVLSEKPKGGKKSKKITMTDGEFLLREIEAFGRRAENYEYTTGWGWDDDYGEERAWGDDSWVEEIGSLFERINDFYEAGDYALAKKAYEKLFEIYLAGNEEGRFSGHDQDEMVGTDLEEAGLKYLRSIYLSEKPSSRPEALLRGINTLSYLSQNTTIHGVIHASMEDLPELDQFGKHWIEYLNKQKENRIVTNLVKEAVRLFEGVKGLEALALEKGHQFPGAFVEWLEALKNDKNYREMIRVARLGLEKLSDRLVIRARIADYLHEAAKKSNLFSVL